MAVIHSGRPLTWYLLASGKIGVVPILLIGKSSPISTAAICSSVTIIHSKDSVAKARLEGMRKKQRRATKLKKLDAAA